MQPDIKQELIYAQRAFLQLQIENANLKLQVLALQEELEKKNVEDKPE